jgi:hypothetical protein
MAHEQPVMELERRILPLLETEADTLRAEFPTANIGTESHSVGSLTSLQGHMAAISCLLVEAEKRTPDRSRTEPDLVDLVVGVEHLTTEPRLADLYVCWGHPSGHVELDLLPAPIALDEAAWRLAEKAIPLLVEALRTAIRRGQPPHWPKPAFPF